MRTRRIGELEVSVVGLGCNNFGMRIDEDRAAEVVAAALDQGITLFDTADVYGAGVSEQYLGKALGPRRDDAIIATKFGSPMGDAEKQGASARWIEQAVEDSLQRLGTDRIDLYQLHRPDMDTPMEETLTALDRLVEQGKVREIGSSNFSSGLIAEADGVAKEKGLARYASVQNHYSLLERRPEARVLPACERLGLGFLPYFPLANGLLTGKYKKGEAPPSDSRLARLPAERAGQVLSEKNLEVVERLDSFASERGRSLLELAFSWLLSRPAVASVIAGATRPEQVKANADAAGWDLAAEELAEIDSIAPAGGE